MRPVTADFLGLVASAYTGDGLRGVKSAGALTYFLYDGDRPVCELSSSGAVTAANTFGPNGLLSRHTASGSALYTWDLSGGLAQRVNTGGGTIGSAVSDGFGAGTTTDNTTDPFSGFGGQWGGYTDAAGAGQTGLTLFTHRFYDPQAGRFLTRDPIGYTGGVNLYGYCANNPVNDKDPSGYFNFRRLIDCILKHLGETVKDGLKECAKSFDTYAAIFNECWPVLVTVNPVAIGTCIAGVVLKDCGIDVGASFVAEVTECVKENDRRCS